jgi:hypothetical protein
MTGHRDTFRPEALPATIPASERGHFEAAPEPGRPGQVRLWLYGDGGQGKPRSIVLTRRDLRGFMMFLHRLAEAPEATQDSRSAARSQTKSLTELAPGPTDPPQAWWRPRGVPPPRRPGPG